jgi:hypothetical protein
MLTPLRIQEGSTVSGTGLSQGLMATDNQGVYGDALERTSRE